MHDVSSHEKACVVSSHLKSHCLKLVASVVAAEKLVGLNQQRGVGPCVVSRNEHTAMVRQVLVNVPPTSAIGAHPVVVGNVELRAANFCIGMDVNAISAGENGHVVIAD